MFPTLPDDDRLLDLLASLLARLPAAMRRLSIVDPGQGPLQWPIPHARSGALHPIHRDGRIPPEDATEAGRLARRLAPVSAIVHRDGHATLQAGDRLAARLPPLLRAGHRLRPVLEDLPDGADLRLGADVRLSAHDRLRQEAVLAASPRLQAFAEQRRTAPIRIRRQGQAVAAQAVASPPLWTPASVWRLPAPRIPR